MNQEAYTKLVKARIALIMEQEFWGTLAMRLQITEDSSVPTLAVDGHRVYYNPEFVLSLTNDLCKSAMGHEVGHVVLDSIGRLNGREPGKWNHATDYKINQMLKESGFHISPDWLLNPAFDAMSAEEVYNILPPGTGQNNQPGKKGSSLDDIKTGAMTQEDIDDWKIATVQAATAAMASGKLPGSLRRLVDEIVNPKVDWRRVLREFVNQTAKDDFSWIRPNKRFMVHGLCMPSLYSETMQSMAVVVDTSGSIDAKTLADFAAEISAIRDEVRPETVYVIYCDAQINRVDTVGKYDDFKIEAVGGGGTDFRPPFDWLEENNIQPQCLAYLTDLYGPTGEQPPYPTLWCCTTDQVGPWGQTLRMN